MTATSRKYRKRYLSKQPNRCEPMSTTDLRSAKQATSTTKQHKTKTAMKLLSLSLLLLSAATPHAFVVWPTTSSSNHHPLRMSSRTDTDNPILLSGVNLDLTPALEAYVDKRIGNILSKLAKNGAVRECDVVLSVNKNPKVPKYNGHCFFLSVALSLIHLAFYLLFYCMIRSKTPTASKSLPT